MATSPSSRGSTPSRVGSTAEVEEAAALAAITLYLEAEREEQEVHLESRGDRWARAGRLESQGIRVTRETFDRGWRR